MAESGQPAQGSDLYFGKYATKEEAEKGWANMISEFNKIKTQSAQLQSQLEASQKVQAQYENMLAQGRQPAEPKAPLYDEDGRLDAAALLQQIDNRLADQAKQLDDIPNIVNRQVNTILQPVVNAQTVEQEFFARDDIDPKYTRDEFNKVLARNRAINNVYKRLMANPESQSEAYETVYELWKSNQPDATPNVAPRKRSQEREAQAQAAGMPKAEGGPPVEVGSEEQADAQVLAEKARMAQHGMFAGADLALAKEWIKGSRLKGMIDSLEEEAEAAGFGSGLPGRT